MHRDNRLSWCIFKSSSMYLDMSCDCLMNDRKTLINSSKARKRYFLTLLFFPHKLACHWNNRFETYMSGILEQRSILTSLVLHRELKSETSLVWHHKVGDSEAKILISTENFVFFITMAHENVLVYFNNFKSNFFPIRQPELWLETKPISFFEQELTENDLTGGLSSIKNP